ncbi:helix-turn-helix domain-containing protein [Methanocella arvoryzae]|uniref:Transcriptional regulator n=1 Tax=Methanocella arvoryzae (strain DSM 22066 / NBRC 105507 / MRE50) TaxID=351160 RepID=Q0W4L2_METAR|nr:putative transcriptional regulator [Methanocella arvoryzae]CAJ36681.1 hypothetical protein RCIX1412 [Methanocella arvoryzae MRE50]
MENNSKGSPDIGRIYSALNSSRVRQDVYEYLCSIYPRKAFIQELSKETRHSVTNLKGSLEGDGISFSYDDALIELGLAESAEIRLYRKIAKSFGATEQGFRIRDRLRNYKRSIGPTHTHTQPLPEQGS